MDELTTAERHALDAWQPFEPPRDFAERVAGLRARPRNATIPLFAGLLVAAAVMLVIFLGAERPASHTVVEPPPPHHPAMEPAPVRVDLRVAAGEPFFVHSPDGVVAVELTYAGACAERELDLDRDITLGHPRTFAGDAPLLLTTGVWIYELRCAHGGPDVALGTITVLEDRADRPLERTPDELPFVLDGKVRSIDYVYRVPDLVVTLPDDGTRWSLEASPMQGVPIVFESAGPVIRVRGANLTDGVYTLVGKRDGVAVGKPTVAFIGRDVSDPSLYLRSTSDGTTTMVAGTTRLGWTGEFDGRALSIDGAGHFGANVTTPSPRTIAIALRYGGPPTHYYLIR